MIKVIQHGATLYRVTCPRCHCLFEFEASDVQIIGPQYDRSVKISCPDCQTVLSGWDIEDLVKAYR